MNASKKNGNGNPTVSGAPDISDTDSGQTSDQSARKELEETFGFAPEEADEASFYL